MRIISGQFKGRRLKGPPPSGIRPTSDKLKETIFDVLAGTVRGSVFLDGFAGTGGVGIEAISRGSSLVVFAEQSRKGCRIIRENLQSLDLKEGYKILEMDLAKAVDVCTTESLQFDIAFVDPPWNRDDFYETVFDRFSRRNILSPGGLLIVECFRRRLLPESHGALMQVRLLVQGDNALGFYRKHRTAVHWQ